MKILGRRTKLDYCRRKPMYDKKTAITAKNKRWHEDHIKLRIYECPHCVHWHLTSKEEWEERK